MPFSSSSDIISLIKKQLGLDEKTFSVMKAWDKEFAPIFSYAELVGLQKGELIIEVLSSVHFQELALRRNEIINKINQYAGKEKVVKGIKIKLKN
ncbi:MAG: DciA family protein [Elusimicrobia bacterium]|nr:DciA family protein [Elusimicrobiota bacterium]